MKFNTIKSLLLLLILLPACGHKICIKHNAYANTKHIPQGFPYFSSFTVETVNHDDPMLSQEITHKIEHMLQKNGYCIQHESKAHYYVLFDYHMKRTKKTIPVEKYIPGKTIISHGSELVNGRAKLYQEETQTPGSWIYVPEEHTFFTKSIIIQVYDAQHYRTGSKPTPIWQETANCCDENGDLRDSLDYLLVTAFKYFGKNTQKNIETTISSDDKDVAELRADVFN